MKEGKNKCTYINNNISSSINIRNSSRICNITKYRSNRRKNR